MMVALENRICIMQSYPSYTQASDCIACKYTNWGWLNFGNFIKQRYNDFWGNE